MFSLVAVFRVALLVCLAALLLVSNMGLLAGVVVFGYMVAVAATLALTYF
jgi:hypothetical protein